jgi:ABC-type uncharacterized transport system involved in gliding motility auxiliary subunit
MNRSNRRSMISAIAGFFALGLFVIALIYWSIRTPAFSFNIGEWDAVLRVLMVGAIIAFSVYLIAAPESVGAAVGKRSTRLTANAFIVSLVAIGIAIAINVLFDTGIQAARADFTANKDFSLSEQTLSILREADARGRPVKATAFYSARANTGIDPQRMEDLLKEYSARSSQVSYEIVDPIVNPAAASALGVTRIGTIVFDNGEKREYANSVSEADFTSALARLLQDKVRRVAFLTGHGERSSASFEQNGYQQITSDLERENYQIASWNLVISPTLTVSDVTVLVIAAPSQAIGSQDMQKIQSYLDNGGRAMLLLDPQMPDEALKPLADLLTRYGVQTVKGAVVDRRSASATDPTLVVVDNYPSPTGDAVSAVHGLQAADIHGWRFGHHTSHPVVTDFGRKLARDRPAITANRLQRRQRPAWSCEHGRSTRPTVGEYDYHRHDKQRRETQDCGVRRR